MFKQSFLSGLLFASLTLPVLSHANALTIRNNTNFDSTSKINDGPCSSSILGAKGVTKAHSTNVISDKMILLACYANRSNCKADVFMTNNCSGPQIATVVFDVNTGVKSVSMQSNNYTISAQGFSITLNGGSKS